MRFSSDWAGAGASESAPVPGPETDDASTTVGALSLLCKEGHPQVLIIQAGRKGSF